MSLREENLLSARSVCITRCITGADAFENVSEKSSEVQPKLNRLRRQKKTAGKESLAVIKTGCEAPLTNSNEICSEDYNQKCLPAAHTSTRNIKKSKMAPLKEDIRQCSPPKHDLLPSKRSLKQSRLNLKALKVSCNEASSDGAQCFSTADSETDIVDLCEDEETHKHVSMVTTEHVKEHRCYNDPPQDSVTKIIQTRRNDDVQRLLAAPGIQKASCSHDSLLKSVNSHEETMSLSTSDWRKDFRTETCEELLKHIQTQNQRFPVKQFFSRLLERRHQFEKALPNLETETSTTCAAPASEKRKQDAEFLHDTRPTKRQRWSGDTACVNISQRANTQNIVCRSRLSVSRRRKQKDTPPPVQSTCSVVETTAALCEVLWTEKYQPQHSEEIIGNSGSVRKLCSWLKEWRMRADVEERRKRREERRRMQEESNESWDCGDFEGEMVMVDCEAELFNTVLIQGPVGAGKTAAVYACAQQLGYKVFEVNSSSLRSGQIVLSQLREATQSHQVGALRSDSTKPQNSHSTHPPATSTGASREDASRKLTASRKISSRKKSAAPPIVTLKHFFKRTDRPVDRSTDSPQDPPHKLCSDKAKHDVLIGAEANTKTAHEEELLNTEERRTPPISLILFEEVNIIFSEDVGFLSAIKTLMTTTKRPVILTTNDPLFSQSFDGRFEEIHFKGPSMETIRSYLQCLCVVESVWPDPDDLSILLVGCEGDVRRSVLELELWMRSRGEKTHSHIQNTALICSSWAELESTGHVDYLVEIWKVGRDLFYSNLDLLFAPLSKTSQNADKEAFEPDKKIEMKLVTPPRLNEMGPGKLSRLKVKKHRASGDELKMTHWSCSKQAHQPETPVKCKGQSESFSAEKSSSKLVSCCLESLACFFDTMSFLDSWIYKQPRQVAGQCQAGPQGWMGAKLTDSLVDELREEEVNPYSERSYEFLAVLESLGFHQCRAELSETCRKAEQLKEVMGRERFTQLMENLMFSKSSDACVSQRSKPSAVQKSREVIDKVLSSKAFCCHGNKKAITMDYLPTLRSICRMERAKQQNRPRFLHYLTEIHLPVPKSTFKLLAWDLH